MYNMFNKRDHLKLLGKPSIKNGKLGSNSQVTLDLLVWPDRF